MSHRPFSGRLMRGQPTPAVADLELRRGAINSNVLSAYGFEARTQNGGQMSIKELESAKLSHATPFRPREVLRSWLLAFAMALVACAIAYLWLDRPIAFFAHDYTARYPAFAAITRVHELFAPLSVVIFIAVGIRFLAAPVLTRMETILLLCSLSFVISAAIKNQLKIVFGRTWPETWVQNNPSLIRDGAFGFNPFRGGIGYESFPSGHTTSICAVAIVLWMFWPQYRVVYALAILAMAAGLIGANYHFLSDVIAGGFIGVSTAWITVLIWRARQNGRTPRTI